MLEAFFKIDVVFGSVSYGLVDHVLLDLIIHTADCINQRYEALEICIYIILDRNAEQIAYSLHCYLGTMCNCCVNALLAKAGNVHIGVTENGKHIELLLNRIQRGNQHGI
ncbi:hypothetical protein D3C80_1735490 [compost metagenome]